MPSTFPDTTYTCAPYTAEAQHWADWQRHVDAGRIGNRLPMPPEVAATIAHNDALFRGIAEDRRRAAWLALTGEVAR